MERLILAIICFGIGYASGHPSNRFWNQDVQIYGGVLFSSPVADVWGYDNDWEACQTLAAGANLVNAKEREMADKDWREFILEWATKGTTSCVWNR